MEICAKFKSPRKIWLDIVAHFGFNHSLVIGVPGSHRLLGPHRLHQHGLLVNLVRQSLFSRHHRVQHELHAEVGAPEVQCAEQ